ncbi:MAG: class I SAM-dependent methyltransferase [Pyrinomonadaceae bacterium]|nr:class I SAM-dependent methyltransferase [Pyrinomonadaceae bacterium]
MIENKLTNRETIKQRKLSERSLYDSVNMQMNEQQFGQDAIFLNYGYVPTDEPQYAQAELAPERRSRNSIKLVLETIGDCTLEGKDVLDVGCGRGGTIATIKEFFNAATLTGVDLSPHAVKFCQTRHLYGNVRFMEGDAENLPFPDHSFDVVTNIESACCYPDAFAFYKQVFRVLRPGGYFLYADIIASEQLASRLEFLRQHFTIERFRDITQNVLASCDKIAARRLNLINGFDKERFMAGLQRTDSGKTYDALISQLLCVPGSVKYNKIRDGLETYVIIKLRKEAR